MTRAQNRRNLMIAVGLTCAVACISFAAHLGWLDQLPQALRSLVVVGLFLLSCALIVFLGPLGLFPHIKRMFPKESRQYRDLGFIPDLED